MSSRLWSHMKQVWTDRRKGHNNIQSDEFMGVSDTIFIREDMSSLSRSPTWSEKSQAQCRRDICLNCGFEFLNELSRYVKFCSKDCQTNAGYMMEVQQRIRATTHPARLRKKGTRPDKAWRNTSNPNQVRNTTAPVFHHSVGH